MNALTNERLNGTPQTEFEIVQKYVDIKMSFTLTKAKMKDLTCIKTSQEAYQCFLDTYDASAIATKEIFYVMALNRANRLLGIYKLSEGGLSGTIVDVRIIAKFLIDVLASSVILCHNHPSGNMRPSREDLEITQKIRSGLKLFDINLSDHIIIGMDDYFSMRDNGHI
jgi:DNA repair protein RadC